MGIADNDYGDLQEGEIKQEHGMNEDGQPSGAASPRAPYTLKSS